MDRSALYPDRTAPEASGVPDDPDVPDVPLFAGGSLPTHGDENGKRPEKNRAADHAANISEVRRDARRLRESTRA
jgi:hypothetical protein